MASDATFGSSSPIGDRISERRKKIRIRERYAIIAPVIIAPGYSCPFIRSAFTLALATSRDSSSSSSIRVSVILCLCSAPILARGALNLVTAVDRAAVTRLEPRKMQKQPRSLESRSRESPRRLSILAGEACTLSSLRRALLPDPRMITRFFIRRDDGQPWVDILITVVVSR